MYDDWQVTFYLSGLASLASMPPVSEQLDKTLPRQQAIAKAQATAQAHLNNLFVTKLTDALGDPAVQKQIGSNWTVAWGPATFIVGPNTVDWQTGIATFTATNSAFVVQNPTNLVLAIAGTNPSSWFDWLAEDLIIVPGVTWESALQSWGNAGKPAAPTSVTTPNITSGTYVGVKYVLELLDAKHATLQSFLSNLKLAGNQTLTVTGHSLGGALSPTLALALVDPQAPLTSLPAAQVRTYPTAGPTPGNAAFAARYLEYFPVSKGESDWQIWNADVWNTYDLVPRAWGIDTLLFLPALYAGAFEYSAADLARLSGFVVAGAAVSELFANLAGTPGRLDTTTIPGNFAIAFAPWDCFAWQYQPPNGETEYLTKPQAKARGIPDSDLKPISLLEQVVFQHVQAYIQFITPDAVAPPQTKVPLPAEVVRRMIASL